MIFPYSIFMLKAWNLSYSLVKTKYVLVISRYKDDIIVITRDLGRAEVECNNNDIIQVQWDITGFYPK